MSRRRRRRRQLAPRQRRHHKATTILQVELQFSISSIQLRLLYYAQFTVCTCVCVADKPAATLTLKQTSRRRRRRRSGRRRRRCRRPHCRFGLGDQILPTINAADGVNRISIAATGKPSESRILGIHIHIVDL